MDKLPRIVRGMPAAEYHAHPAVSRSDLGLVHRCPALFKAKRDGLLPESESPALAFGTLAHTAILELEELPKRYATFDGRRGTKAHKEALASAEGRELVKTADWEKAQAMAEAIRAHPAARELLAEGEAETSCFWKDPETGIACKCRLDWVTPGAVVDVKTAACAAADEFSKACWRYAYHRQAAFYLDGATACGLNMRRFVLLVVEKDPPHLCACYELDAMDIELGRQSCHRDLATLQACLDAETRGEPNAWPGYGDNVQPLALPRWAYYEEQEQEEMTA
jgi:exodeoxyribonuclease VIII